MQRGSSRAPSGPGIEAKALLTGLATVAGTLALAGSAPAMPLGKMLYLAPPTAASQPFKLASGPEGNMWFTERAGKIGVVNSATHAISEFSTPTTGSNPEGIVLGAEGDLWFAETGVNKIGEIDPETHEIHEFPVPTPESGPSSIVIGPEGNVWFAEEFKSKIGEINPVTHEAHDFPTPTAESSPEGITVGPEGRIWFSEPQVDRVGEINPATDETADFATPGEGDHPTGMATGPEGNIWFADYGTAKLGFINPISHQKADYAAPGAMNPSNIAVGAEGNLWFTDVNAGEIGQFNPVTHAFSDFPNPMNKAQPEGIALGPDGNLWFGEIESSEIGVLGANATAASILAPVVAGGGQVGVPQVCEGAQWSNFAGQQPLAGLYGFDGFKWLLNGSVIAGQTGESFTPSAGEAGGSLACSETATYPLTQVTATAMSQAVTVIGATTGPTGATGAAGPKGANGANGRVELIKCKASTAGSGTNVAIVQRCTTVSTGSTPASITNTGASLAAVLSRGKTVYATGLLIGTRKRSQLMMTPRRTIVRGHYTLTLKNGREHLRETITIA